ncbi:MAG: hypothetical protein AW07_01845 [Candidatus Accumulibacter sp. SK-11]|nr:MAG: hypothetical protein AW07_01845 [Candidatus Accumulibacter sp. SK-11]HRL74602.1 hypothetical protein [Candidatus Accumulibacter phosphatis]
MKNIILGSVLAVAAVTSLSAHAVAQSICSGTAAGNGAQVNAGTNFVKVDFIPKCSANVLLQGNDLSSTVYLVGAASVKGKNTFKGSSVGGSVGVHTACSASPCTTGEVDTAIGAAPSS